MRDAFLGVGLIAQLVRRLILLSIYLLFGHVVDDSVFLKSLDQFQSSFRWDFVFALTHYSCIVHIHEVDDKACFAESVFMSLFSANQ